MKQRPGFDLHTRAAGVLLHLTSLPGPHGNGDLGRPAHELAERLAATGVRWWQMLPVGPVGYGNSPYSALSALGGDPLLIDFEDLVSRGWLTRRDLRGARALPRERIDHAAAAAFRERALRKAFAAFAGDRAAQRAFRAFCRSEADWLDDLALFLSLKQRFNLQSWTTWPRLFRDRHPSVLGPSARGELAHALDFHRFEQWIFATQWAAFRAHCNGLGLGLLGDLPIFVAHDSADVWAQRALFKLSASGAPTVVAGVPPDYFSATGQRWGNPLYRWDVLRARGYSWWVRRMELALRRFDAVRLDHFIGYSRCWEIPAREPTAEKGRFAPGPGADLFEKLQAKLGPLPLLAEDLGVLTPAVTALRERFGFPGLRILQFAFGTDPSAPDFKPHNYVRNTAAYTGTHDNDTALGWFDDRGEGGTRSPAQVKLEREAALRYLGSGGREFNWALIRAVMASVAGLAIVPAQDLLGLGSEARMNLPGTSAGNWTWRLREGALDDRVLARLGGLLTIYERRVRR